jgi:hypothetical protein
MRPGDALVQADFESLLGDLDPSRLRDFLNEDEVSDLGDTAETDYNE